VRNLALSPDAFARECGPINTFCMEGCHGSGDSTVSPLGYGQWGYRRLRCLDQANSTQVSRAMIEIRKRGSQSEAINAKVLIEFPYGIGQHDQCAPERAPSNRPGARMGRRRAAAMLSRGFRYSRR